MLVEQGAVLNTSQAVELHASPNYHQESFCFLPAVCEKVHLSPIPHQLWVQRSCISYGVWILKTGLKAKIQIQSEWLLKTSYVIYEVQRDKATALVSSAVYISGDFMFIEWNGEQNHPNCFHCDFFLPLYLFVFEFCLNSDKWNIIVLWIAFPF